MSQTVVETLRSEERRLWSALQARPEFRQLAAVREALARLEPAYGTIAGSTRQDGSPVRGREREGSLTAMARNLALAEIERTGRRIRSSDVVVMLGTQGVQVSGKKPQATIASLLSADPRLENRTDHRGVGYGLRDWSGEAPPFPGPTTEEIATPDADALV